MKAFFKSFVYAFNGIRLMLRGERNFYVHILAAIIAISLAYYFPLNFSEKAIIVLISALVLSAEIFNSSIERLIDLLHPHKGDEAGNIKDMTAGAVLILAIASVVIAVIIFLPYLMRNFSKIGLMLFY